MSLSPQLQPTDYAELTQIEDREEREKAYADNSIYVKQDARGVRYTKGDDPNAPSRGWQSLDAILRSDANSAAMLPRRKQRAARILTALTVVAGIATTAGFVASAREGLDLKAVNGTGALLLSGGLVTLGCAVAAGVMYGRMRSDYEKAVDVYNDSLGLRLGLYDAAGEYVPPKGVRVDEEGFVILETPEDELYGPRPQPAPAPAPAPTPEPEEVGAGEVGGAEGEAPAPDDDGAAAAPPDPDDPSDDDAADEDAPAPAPAPKIQRPQKQGALILLPLR